MVKRDHTAIMIYISSQLLHDSIPHALDKKAGVCLAQSHEYFGMMW